MQAAEFLGLEPTDEPHRWRLPVKKDITSGIGALFGGIGLAAAVEAMERHTERPLIWATAQYLSFARPPSVVDIEVVDAAVGHKTSQVRATGHVDGHEIFTVNAAVGRRDFPAEGQWAVAPEVPAPENCPARQIEDRMRGRLMTRMETRIARGRRLEELPGEQGDGRRCGPASPVSTCLPPRSPSSATWCRSASASRSGCEREATAWTTRFAW
jgi:acyl-CoA thioesterase